jgi:hypothetical protein
MKLSLRFKKPKIVAVSKNQPKVVYSGTGQESITIEYIDEWHDPFTIPEVLRAAADRFEKSEGKE